jgi:hypothetical protein
MDFANFSYLFIIISLSKLANKAVVEQAVVEEHEPTAVAEQESVVEEEPRVPRADQSSYPTVRVASLETEPLIYLIFLSMASISSSHRACQNYSQLLFALYTRTFHWPFKNFKKKNSL